MPCWAAGPSDIGRTQIPQCTAVFGSICQG